MGDHAGIHGCCSQHFCQSQQLSVNASFVPVNGFCHLLCATIKNHLPATQSTCCHQTRHGHFNGIPMSFCDFLTMFGPGAPKLFHKHHPQPPRPPTGPKLGMDLPIPYNSLPWFFEQVWCKAWGAVGFFGQDRPVTPSHTQSHPVTPSHTQSHPVTPSHTQPPAQVLLKKSISGHTGHPLTPNHRWTFQWHSHELL